MNIHLGMHEMTAEIENVCINEGDTPNPYSRPMMTSNWVRTVLNPHPHSHNDPDALETA